MSKTIYKIVNLVNDKFYVGSSTDIKNRWAAHRKLLRGNRHHCKHLQAAWNKYGEIKFAFEIVEEVSEAHSLWAVEDAYLVQHVGKGHCYNAGRSAEAPMRGRTGALHPQFGVPLTEERRKDMSETMKKRYASDPTSHPRLGKKHTPETLAKIAINRTAPAGEKHYNYGQAVSSEVREKIGATQRGVSKAPRTFTPEGLVRAQENMKRNAREQPPADFQAVHAKFPAEVQARYDFHNAVYTGALIRIEGVFCAQHGVFSQYSAQFRKGAGCPKCGADQRAASKRVQMEAAWRDPVERGRMLAARIKPVAPSAQP